MTEYQLIPHPDFPSAALSGVRVDAERIGEELSIWFWLSGDIENVRWPDLCADGIRADELWKETCFEAFVRVDGKPGYSELNFSPSGRWAAYQFDRYREGMRDIERGQFGSGYKGTHDNGEYGMNFGAIGAFDRVVDWTLGLTAIIEAMDGTKSYWALAHAPGPPDFHNPDCFIATLPAPAGP
jgi:hypothetical protein